MVTGKLMVKSQKSMNSRLLNTRYEIINNIIIRFLLTLLMFIFSCLPGYTQQRLNIHVEKAGTLGDLLPNADKNNRLFK